jgi:hypothetical protein
MVGLLLPSVWPHPLLYLKVSASLASGLLMGSKQMIDLIPSCKPTRGSLREAIGKLRRSRAKEASVLNRQAPMGLVTSVHAMNREPRGTVHELPPARFEAEIPDRYFAASDPLCPTRPPEHGKTSKADFSLAKVYKI